MKNYCETIYYCATLKAEIVAGRKSCAKKILRRKSPNFRNFFFRNNVIFHNSQLFLPQQYNLSQFASFFPAIYTLRILTDVPQLTNFFTSFALPSPAPYSNPPPLPPPPHPMFIIFTLTDIHARYYQILLTFLTLIVVWVIFLPILATLLKLHPLRFSSPFIKYLEKVMIQKKKMMKRLKTINFSVVFM